MSARDEKGRFTAEDPIPALRRYWSDPAYRDEMEADRAILQAEVHAKMDAAIRRYLAAEREALTVLVPTPLGYFVKDA
jgi:hypothetical protein